MNTGVPVQVLLKKVPIAFITHTIIRPEQDPGSLTGCLSHQEVSISLLSLSIRGQTEWKPQSQKTNQIDQMDNSLVYLNETMRHAM